MGTNVIPIANHSIQFKEKNFQTLSTEIIDRLKSHCLNYAQKNWQVRPENQWYQFDSDQWLEFGETIEEEEIEVTQHYIQFLKPSYRYQSWCQSVSREEYTTWYQYYREITLALGGDRLIYLADNAHPLEKYLDMGSFNVIEEQLKQAYGSPSKQRAAIYYNQGYFMEFFHRT